MFTNPLRSGEKYAENLVIIVQSAFRCCQMQQKGLLMLEHIGLHIGNANLTAALNRELVSLVYGQPIA